MFKKLSEGLGDINVAPTRQINKSVDSMQKLRITSVYKVDFVGEGLALPEIIKQVKTTISAFSLWVI